MTTAGFPRYQTEPSAHPTRRSDLLRRSLLVVGILILPLYVVINILGAMQWENYSFVSQAVSELSAIDAPSRPLLTRLGAVYDLFVFAFALGVWRSAGQKRCLRVAAVLLFGTVLVDILFRFAPMHMRGAEPTATDTMHIVLTGAMVLFILLAVGFSAAAFGRRFRLYAIASIVLMLVSGAWTGLEARGVPTNRPTPWLGLAERITIGLFLVWLAVLAIALLRRGKTDPP